MHTRHRLCQFRKSKHVLHQRFRSRIFHRDTMAAAELKKPFVVVLTGAGMFTHFHRDTMAAAELKSRLWWC